MLKLVLVPSLSIGSVILGYLLQRFIQPRKSDSSTIRKKLPAEIARWIKLLAVAGLIPWPVLFSFWRAPVIDPKLIILPFLGVLSLSAGGAASLLMIRFFKISSDKAGSLFACGSMTNLGVLGGLVGMMFFGNEGYLTVQLFIMFETIVYYLIVFPVSQQIGSGGGFEFRPGLLFSRPLVLVPVAAILAGFILRAFKVPSPVYLDRISAVMVAMIAGLIGISIGLTLKVSRVRRYARESMMISLIKFVIIPAIVIPVAAVLGLPDLQNGTAFKTVVILSFGPVALMAMVPAQLYNLDLDLANAAWLVTTLVHLLIVTVLILVLA